MNYEYKALDHITSSDIEALGISAKLAERIHEKLNEIIRNYGPATPDTWQNICERILTPDLPFSFHQMMYYGCYKDFGPDPPAWIPDPYVTIFYKHHQMWTYIHNCGHCPQFVDIYPHLGGGTVFEVHVKVDNLLLKSYVYVCMIYPISLLRFIADPKSFGTKFLLVFYMYV